VPQALLSGVPVVVYDVDGAPEACENGQTGRLVEPGDLNALRESVMWMMDHPHERAAMGERGREVCRERFDASAMVEKLETVYASVLKRPADGNGAGAG
jgi:glycosyltransferase involved in cell wall biosynthesis